MTNNMLLPLEYLKEFADFSNEKIDFHTHYKKYRINNMWLDEINENFFHERINEFIEGLKVILISNNNNLLIVDQLLKNIQSKLYRYRNDKIQYFESFLSHISNIEQVNFAIEYDVPETYTIQKVLDYNFDGNVEEDNIIYCLFAHKDQNNNYVENDDFEKVKLYFFINQFYKSLFYFEEKINYLKNAIQVYGVTDLSHFYSENKTPENKCNIKLDKISSAALFKILIKAKLIYMDSDELKSESKIKKFVETHFNYTDTKLGIKPLTDFSKEYSKVKDKARSNKQLDVLNLLSKYIRTETAKLN
ncbi:hypothetical protein [Flavobacterium ammonificans]|uniref:DUF262 domain-containing protein n=1 Tax=Flavobacterium ammonificans TaxID=1751056 RepID=A0ABN6KVE6_9FLAO|nr:hypothetical protein [Flavobacterium ammonificans]BDB53089.1 hypothetical protein GENT11_14010 [Flavobacterium ammonificans]